MTTPELVARMMKHWQPPAYYVLQEVRNGTGYARNEGYADALVMSVWPSRGLELIGAELKVSRSDWLKEYRDPKKADKFFKYCHRWYLITGSDIAQESEIPATWGHMTAGPNGLKTVKAAPELKPEPPDTLLLAAIFRKAAEGVQGMVSESEVHKLVLANTAKKSAELEAAIASQMERNGKERQNHEALRNAVFQFSNASGIEFDTWQPDAEKYKASAELYRAFKNGGLQPFKDKLKKQKEDLEGYVSYLSRLLENNEH